MQTLKLTKERLKAVRDGSLTRLNGSNRNFFRGVKVEYVGEGNQVSSFVFNHQDTQFIGENSSPHENLMIMKDDKERDQDSYIRALTFVPTYSSFAEFLSRMKQTRHAQKLSERFKAVNAKTAEAKLLIMFYVTWLMIPAWAKSATEFKKYWGADVAKQFPFNSPNRLPL